MSAEPLFEDSSKSSRTFNVNANALRVNIDSRPRDIHGMSAGRRAFCDRQRIESMEALERALQDVNPELAERFQEGAERLRIVTALGYTDYHPAMTPDDEKSNLN